MSGWEGKLSESAAIRRRRMRTVFWEFHPRGKLLFFCPPPSLPWKSDLNVLYLAMSCTWQCLVRGNVLYVAVSFSQQSKAFVGGGLNEGFIFFWRLLVCWCLEIF